MEGVLQIFRGKNTVSKSHGRLEEEVLVSCWDFFFQKIGGFPRFITFLSKNMISDL
jgi:hypothetical protein